MNSVEDAAKFGLQHIVRFALLWVRNAIIVVQSITSLTYVGKKLNKTRNSRQDNGINKVEIVETTENKHFNPDLETRIKCDASRKGLGCALEQRTPNGWHTVAFASPFFNSLEDRYSINELELLGVVWSIEHFKYYLSGKPFTVISNHRALLSIIREKKLTNLIIVD